LDKGDSLIWQLLLLLLLVLINSFFTCAEIALISLNKNKLEKLSASGSRQAKRIVSLTSQPAKFIATVQVAITLAGFLSSAIAAKSFSPRLTERLISFDLPFAKNTLETISLVSITLILSFFTLVLGELLPKRIALKNADTLAYAISGIVLFISRLFAPLVWLLTKTTNGILRLFGISPEADAVEVTEEEIRLMIDLGSTKGTIKSGEKEFLNNVFEFDNKTAEEVMTHRRDIALLYLEESDEEWEQIITEKRRSNYPVCGKDSDDIKGILNTRDYLSLKDRSRETALAKAMRPARFVPFSVRTDILFRQMKTSRNHFAVVVDEYGSMMGIVTMNDLLEELVGDLEDDSSAPPEPPAIERKGENEWHIRGTAALDEVAGELEIELPVEDYDTFAGFVFGLLGYIPEDGNMAELETPVLNIKILEIQERRLEKALVRKTEAQAPVDSRE
jgi:putative hemolysin